VWLTVTFVVVFVGLRKLLQAIRASGLRFSLPPLWPISIVQLRPVGAWQLSIALATVALFAVATWRLVRSRYRLREVIAFGIALVVATNMIHGWSRGIAAPIAYDARSGVFVPISSDGEQLYHDALGVSNPVQLLREYTDVQLTLHQHSRTHPPGAVLMFYMLIKLLRNPATIAIAIAAVALSLSLYFFRALLTRELNVSAGPYVTFLYALVPAVQIYYLANLDAIVATLLLGGVYLFLRPGILSMVGSTLFFASGLFLTFASIFALPLVTGFELLRLRTLRRSIALGLSLLAIYGMLYLVFGFNYWASFQIASRYENPRGFRGFAEPINFAFTRLENVAEIALFFGPFLGALLVRHLRRRRTWPDLDLLFGLAVGTLILMFLAGAYRTGETARSCMYALPYLFLPVAAYLSDRRPSERDQVLLASLVFGQAVAMQLAANYYW